MNNEFAFNQALQSLLSLDLSSDMAYELKANAMYQIGNIDHALFYFSKAIEINPECSSAMTNIAEIYKMSGKYKEAIEHYKRALEINVDMS